MPFWTPQAQIKSPASTASAFPVLGIDMPELWGAKYDAVTNNFIAMTAGSNVITATNTPFTAADENKLAWVYGAGANGQHLVGYLHFVNSSTVNLLATPGGAAQNAVTTVSKAGLMAYGTDDATAIAAAFASAKANNRALFLGPRKYMTSGTLSDGGNQLVIYGVGRKLTEIWCTNPVGFYITDATALQRCWIHDFTLHAVVHGIADLRAQANASGFQQKIFERLEILDFTGCGWQDNTTDGPYYRLNDVSFTGWDELNTILFAAGGLQDSSALNDVSFGGAYRVGAKFSRGGPNASVEGNNGFVNGVSGTIATLTDGAMTALSTTLTSAADGRFDSSMVGLSIMVPKADTNQANLQTNIVSVTNSTTIVLAHPAQLTVSGAAVVIRAKQRPLRTVLDGATTAGSKTITSATANFTSADIGSGINVVGAGFPASGAGGGNLNARIQSITNSTTVVVNVAATVTVSGAFTTVSYPQIKMQVVPDALVNSGLGFTVSDIKFGSELIRPGDTHVAFCDEALVASVSDAAMTAASATLTSATASFNAGMVKTHYVTVQGVGLNGGAITARIIGFTNSTTVTIDVSATTTASAQGMTLYKAHGERMPVIDTPSTGTVAQAQFINCPFSNADNGQNGFTLAPFYSTTNKLYGNNFGPGNIEQGSGYLWHVEFGPGVTTTPDRYQQSNQVYPMVDNNAGKDRPSPAISSIPGMVAKQLNDPTQITGVRLPSFSPLHSGASLRVSHACKTRMSGFGVSANAHVVTASLNDPEMGADSSEFSFDTSAGTISCTLLQADIVAGEPYNISFDVAPGSANPVTQVKVIIRYTGAGTIHFQEYVDVPAGADTITLRWTPTESTSNFNFVFATDVAGQIKLGEPLVYRAREPINFFRRRWLSPNGTSYTETIDNNGTLKGVRTVIARTRAAEWQTPAVPTGTLAMTLNKLYAVPVDFFDAQTLTALALEITVAATAGGLVRLGAYADDGTGKPGALIVDAGTIDATILYATTPGQITGLSSVRGVERLFLAAAAQVAAPTVRTAQGAIAGIGATGTTPPANNTYSGWAENGTATSGALPGTFPAATPLGNTPRVCCKT